MKVTLLKEDIELIEKALIQYRCMIEEDKGQNEEFRHCASLADRLAFNHNGAQLIFVAPEN